MKSGYTRAIILLVGLNIAGATFINAQNKTTETTEARKYREVVEGRADKIVAGLGIRDSATYYSVRQTIANHYIQINEVHARRDTQVNRLKASNLDKASQEARKTEIEKDLEGRVAIVHQQFESDLARQLTDEQVSMVKDGLTYNVLNVTYTAYQAMIPTLTEVQKKQIYEWLLEAREHAIDGESSDKKHWWFGKYKGRINNYLSAEGYDLQAERAAWEKRIAENKENRKR